MTRNLTEGRTIREPFFALLVATVGCYIIATADILLGWNGLWWRLGLGIGWICQCASGKNGSEGESFGEIHLKFWYWPCLIMASVLMIVLWEVWRCAGWRESWGELRVFISFRETSSGVRSNWPWEFSHHHTNQSWLPAKLPWNRSISQAEKCYAACRSPKPARKNATVSDFSCRVDDRNSIGFLEWA